MAMFALCSAKARSALESKVKEAGQVIVSIRRLDLLDLEALQSWCNTCFYVFRLLLRMYCLTVFFDAKFTKFPGGKAERLRAKSRVRGIGVGCPVSVAK